MHLTWLMNYSWQLEASVSKKVTFRWTFFIKIPKYQLQNSEDQDQYERNWGNQLYIIPVWWTIPDNLKHVFKKVIFFSMLFWHVYSFKKIESTVDSWNYFSDGPGSFQMNIIKILKLARMLNQIKISMWKLQVHNCYTYLLLATCIR